MRKRFQRVPGRRGQAAVEFVLAMPIVLLMFLALFEFSRHYYTRMNIRNAVSDAARFAATGQLLLDEDGAEMTRAQTIVSVIQNRAYGMNLNVDNITIDPASGGGPDEVVRINATYEFEFVAVPLVNYFLPPSVEFTVATTFKNEPVF